MWDTLVVAGQRAGQFFLGLMALLDRGGVQRKIMHYTTLYMTVNSYIWAKHFADTSTRPELEVAAIIGAVLAAVSAMQSVVFHVYVKSSATKTEDKQ